MGSAEAANPERRKRRKRAHGDVEMADAEVRQHPPWLRISTHEAAPSHDPNTAGAMACAGDNDDKQMWLSPIVTPGFAIVG